MRCFYHPQSDAIGLCKFCCKGLCPQCAVDLAHGLACKDRCEREVAGMQEMIAKEKIEYEKRSSTLSLYGVLYFCVGLAFLIVGSVVRPDFFLFSIGAILTAGASWFFFQGRKYRRLDGQSHSPQPSPMAHGNRKSNRHPEGGNIGE